MALTRRQRQVLDVIRGFIERNGYSPSLEEIGAELGLSSVATVHKHVTHLVDKGYVRRAWNQNRSIEPTEIDLGGARRVPLSGSLAGGAPLEAATTEETITVPSEMLRNRGTSHALRARGDALRDVQIRDGDYLIVEERQEARDGETVVALADGGIATVVRFERQRLAIHGIVIGVIRTY